jgi:hypothetical protein
VFGVDKEPYCFGNVSIEVTPIECTRLLSFPENEEQARDWGYASMPTDNDYNQAYEEADGKYTQHVSLTVDGQIIRIRGAWHEPKDAKKQLKKALQTVEKILLRKLNATT